MRHPKNVTKSNVGDPRTTKTSPAHLPIQSDRKPTKESLGCLRHNGRYSHPLKEMLLFSADGHIQKVTHCSPPPFFSFVKPQFRTPREIATNHSWPPLFGCSLIWGLKGGRRYILWRFTTDYRCVYFQSARRKADWIACLACFGPKQSEIVASSDDFFCYLLFSGKNCVLNWDN